MLVLGFALDTVIDLTLPDGEVVTLRSTQSRTGAPRIAMDLPDSVRALRLAAKQRERTQAEEAKP